MTEHILNSLVSCGARMKRNKDPAVEVTRLNVNKGFEADRAEF
jgi:hypothetical protein